MLLWLEHGKNFPILVMERDIMNYANIDMEKTGQLLKTTIQEAGFNVKYIQEYLHLSCPQPFGQS